MTLKLKGKILVLFLGFLLFSAKALSQFCVGGTLGYNHYLGATGLRHLSLGAFGEFGMGGNSIRPSVTFGFPSKYERTFDLYHEGTTAIASTVEGHERYVFWNAGLDYKYYMGGGTIEDGGFYFLTGAGINMITLDYRVGEYDDNLYDTDNDYTKKERFFQPNLRFAVGGELFIKFANFFIEPYFVLPANQLSIFFIPINIPASVGINTGAKFFF